MFKILKKSKVSQARLGSISLPHGKIMTPCFFPDATRGAIRNLSSLDLINLKLDGLVVNTYHLLLKPGQEIIKESQGIHNFMSWQRPVLSDSGGYQVFSLVHKNHKMGKILEKGIIFKSPLNGSKLLLSPEKSIEFQFDLGADMVVCLDDCPPHDLVKGKLKESINRTIAWAKRSQAEYNRQVKKRKFTSKKKPLLIAVIQGGTDNKLRQSCAQDLLKLGFDGYGFGGRPIDSQGRFLKKVLDLTASSIPEKKLRFGLGIGLPEDIVRSVKMGWDMFDCVIPTREGRHGRLFLQKRISNFSAKGGFASGGQYLISNNFYNTINITNARFARDFSPINKQSALPELREMSKAYLHHLFKVNEPLSLKLASLNNLEFYVKLMIEIRHLINSGKL